MGAFVFLLNHFAEDARPREVDKLTLGYTSKGLEKACMNLNPKSFTQVFGPHPTVQF